MPLADSALLQRFPTTMLLKKHVYELTDSRTCQVLCLDCVGLAAAGWLLGAIRIGHRLFSMSAAAKAL